MPHNHIIRNVRTNFPLKKCLVRQLCKLMASWLWEGY